MCVRKAIAVLFLKRSWDRQDFTKGGGQKQYAKMLLDMNGTMVRSAHVFVFVCLFSVFVFTCSVCDCDSHTSSSFLFLPPQVSATEECVGPMRLTQEPIQVRVKQDFVTSGIMFFYVNITF